MWFQVHFKYIPFFRHQRVLLPCIFDQLRFPLIGTDLLEKFKHQRYQMDKRDRCRLPSSCMGLLHCAQRRTEVGVKSRLAEAEGSAQAFDSGLVLGPSEDCLPVLKDVKFAQLDQLLDSH